MAEPTPWPQYGPEIEMTAKLGAQFLWCAPVRLMHDYLSIHCCTVSCYTSPPLPTPTWRSARDHRVRCVRLGGRHLPVVGAPHVCAQHRHMRISTCEAEHTYSSWMV